MPPHDLTIGAIGGVILWFGWYGFNPGSTLSAMDWEGIGRVSANTTLAACAGGLSASVRLSEIKKWTWHVRQRLPRGPRRHHLPLLLGVTVGIVHHRGDRRSVVIIGVDLLEYLRIDDPIGACRCTVWPASGARSSLGLLATGEYGSRQRRLRQRPGKGLFYGGGGEQLKWRSSSAA